MKNSKKNHGQLNEVLKLKIFYVLGYAAMGAMNPLIGQYLRGIGFTGTQIGTITSVATAIAVLASAFWGSKYANSRDGRKVIALMCISAAVMGLINTLVDIFVVFIITYGIQYFFQGPVMGVADALALEKDHKNFSAIRLFGAVGYAAAVFAGGRCGEYLGLISIFYIYGITFLLGAFMIMTTEKGLNRTESVSGNKVEKISYGLLLKNKKAVQVILCGMFVMGTNVANNTYFGFLFKDGGGTVAGIGTTFLLMVGSEAPFMALAPRLCRKFSQQKIILVAMILSALRFGFYALQPPYQFLMITFFLQGMVNGILLTEYVKYLSSVVKPHLVGISISAFYAVSSNGGTILCSFFGGIVMDLWGSCGVYGFFSLLNLVGVILYLIYGLQNSGTKQEKKVEKKS